MSKVFLRSLLVSPVLLGLALAGSASAKEASTLDQVSQYANEGANLSQVRSVNQLSDVKPTDWAYQALRSLTERYGCIAGYPDRTFRGGRAMTRYEFAAGLNACLDKVNELIASATADLATQEDLKVLQRLQDEFQAELATLRGRVDALEARTSELEANQFSTTTKLTGEVLFNLQDEFGTPKYVNGGSGVNTTFGSRVRLNLTSSFTGSDKLRMRLQSRNIATPGSTTTSSSSYPTGRLEYAGVTPSNSIVLDQLYYTFKPTKKSTVIVGTANTEPEFVVPSTAYQSNSFSTKYTQLPVFYRTAARSIAIGGHYQWS